MSQQADLIHFLMEAKRATYAADGAQAAASRPHSHDLRYARGPFLYIDSYLGSERFSGEEALWEDGAPVWAMNYTGRVTGAGFSGAFLKAALMRVPEAAPYRGPALYRDGEYTYCRRNQGDFDWFEGTEEIYLGGTEIYACRFHGGCVR